MFKSYEENTKKFSLKNVIFEKKSGFFKSQAYHELKILKKPFFHFQQLLKIRGKFECSDHQNRKKQKN